MGHQKNIEWRGSIKCFICNNITIPVHEGCSESSETLGISSGTHHKSSERKENSSETTSRSSETTSKSSETASKSSERKAKSSERGSETKDLIIDIIKQNPHITAAEIAMQLNMSSRGVEKQIRKLRELGKIKRTGGRFGGYWEIIISDNYNAAKD